MIYAPHTIEVKKQTVTTDQWGNPSVSAEWIPLGECRCDDNTTKEFRSENGSVFRPAYHVVGERINVKAGEEVRCMDGNSLRGEGVVYAVKQSNYLDYTELWM